MVIELLTWRKKFIQEEGAVLQGATVQGTVYSALPWIVMLRCSTGASDPPLSWGHHLHGKVLLNRQYSFM